jgi:hypothetical protein
MRIRVKQAIAAASMVLAAGAATGAGLTAASATAARPATASGTEHFQLMSTSATSNKGSFIARGVFTAGGMDVQGKNDTVKLPGGGFTITHKQAKGSQHFDPSTCLMTITSTGTYKITKGTGKYAGIRGHGNYRLSILAVGARTSGGKCSKSRPPVAFQQLIRASGPVSGVK